ncbi:MAG TPA: hypothetical protein VK668_05235 [Mucilaginibacter sp.]|nr:hypothetical protein [Mucilaginibacter sp.]
MFEKLFLLVKNNAGTAVINNPEIPEKDRESVIIEASSSIIEVLKGQMESGKMKDLVKFFQFPEISSSLINSVVNKFASKLNKFYGIGPASALITANSLIPPVMYELTKQDGENNKELAITVFLSKLNGNRADLSGLVHQMMAA